MTARPSLHVMPTTATTEPLLTVEDVARILRLKPKQVYGLHIPCIRVSRRAMRFRQSEFNTWLEARAGRG